MKKTDDNNAQKRVVIFTLIAVLVSIISLIGSAYSYYNVVGKSDTTSTSVSGASENFGRTSLLNPTSELHIQLSAIDLNKANEGKKYYATNDNNKKYDIEEVKREIAVASVIGGEDNTKYQCNSVIELTIDGSMKDALVKGDGKIILTPSTGIELFTQEIDLKDLVDGNPLTIPVTYKIVGNTTEKIEGVVLINNTDKDQINLAGKQININIVSRSFECELVDNFESSKTEAQAFQYILSKTPANLNATTITEDELAYRYQGSATNVNNNYICFGTDDKNNCVNNPNDYMYRIIGIDKNNKLKLIKANDWKTTEWDDGKDCGVNGDCNIDLYIFKNWNDSDLYKELNGTETGQFLETFDNNWQNKIEMQSWSYSDILEVNQSALEVLKKERETGRNNVSAKIGLMNVADYYYASNVNGYNCYKESSEFGSCKTSWIHLSNNGSIEGGEWLLSQAGDYSNPFAEFGGTIIWSILANGGVDSYFARNNLVVRPVFYLKNDVIIFSGMGTIDNPYMIKL